MLLFLHIFASFSNKK